MILPYNSCLLSTVLTHIISIALAERWRGVSRVNLRTNDLDRLLLPIVFVERNLFNHTADHVLSVDDICEGRIGLSVNKVVILVREPPVDFFIVSQIDVKVRSRTVGHKAKGQLGMWSEGIVFTVDGRGDTEVGQFIEIGRIFIISITSRCEKNVPRINVEFFVIPESMLYLTEEAGNRDRHEGNVRHFHNEEFSGCVIIFLVATYFNMDTNVVCPPSESIDAAREE